MTDDYITQIDNDSQQVCLLLHFKISPAYNRSVCCCNCQLSVRFEFLCVHACPPGVSIFIYSKSVIRYNSHPIVAMVPGLLLHTDLGYGDNW